MSTLYELTADWQELQEMLESEAYDEETIKNTMECVKYEIEIKAENYGKIIKNIDASKKSVEAAKQAVRKEIERLDSKIKALDKSINVLKENLGETMKLMGERTIKTNLFTFYFQNNKSVFITDEKKALEGEYIKKEIKLDKKALLEALKNGKEIEYAELKEEKGLRMR